MQGGGGETPVKSHRPVASSGTIPTCKDPGANRPGIELGSPKRETYSEETAAILTCTNYSYNLKVDLLWRSRLVRHPSGGGGEALGSNPEQGMGALATNKSSGGVPALPPNPNSRGEEVVGRRGTCHVISRPRGHFSQSSCCSHCDPTLLSTLAPARQGRDRCGRAAKPARLPPMQTGLYPRSGNSRIFACGNRVGRCCWSAAGIFRRRIILITITLIGSQDLAVKSRPISSFTPLINATPVIFFLHDHRPATVTFDWCPRFSIMLFSSKRCSLEKLTSVAGSAIISGIELEKDSNYQRLFTRRDTDLPSLRLPVRFQTLGSGYFRPGDYHARIVVDTDEMWGFPPGYPFYCPIFIPLPAGTDVHCTRWSLHHLPTHLRLRAHSALVGGETRCVFYSQHDLVQKVLRTSRLADEGDDQTIRAMAFKLSTPPTHGGDVSPGGVVAARVVAPSALHRYAQVRRTHRTHSIPENPESQQCGDWEIHLAPIYCKFILHNFSLKGQRLISMVKRKRATVDERLARSPATKANRAQSPAGPPDSCMCRFSPGSTVFPALSFRHCSILTSVTLIGSQDHYTMPLVNRFSWGSPIFPTPSFRHGSMHCFTLIGSEDLNVKSCPNLCTPLYSCVHQSCKVIERVTDMMKISTATIRRKCKCVFMTCFPEQVFPVYPQQSLRSDETDTQNPQQSENPESQQCSDWEAPLVPKSSGAAQNLIVSRAIRVIDILLVWNTSNFDDVVCGMQINCQSAMLDFCAGNTIYLNLKYDACFPCARRRWRSYKARTRRTGELGIATMFSSSDFNYHAARVCVPGSERRTSSIRYRSSFSHCQIVHTQAGKLAADAAGRCRGTGSQLGTCRLAVVLIGSANWTLYAPMASPYCSSLVTRPCRPRHAAGQVLSALSGGFRGARDVPHIHTLTRAPDPHLNSLPPATPRRLGMGCPSSTRPRVRNPLVRISSGVAHNARNLSLFVMCQTLELCRTMPLVGGFSRGFRVSPRPCILSLRHKYSSRFIRIGSQDHDDKSLPKHLHSTLCCYFVSLPNGTKANILSGGKLPHQVQSNLSLRTCECSSGANKYLGFFRVLPYHEDELRIRRPAFDLDDHGAATFIIANWLSPVSILRSSFHHVQNARRYERTACK
ncbi:hypothetical protein PR048_006308 [Dryococelus australis]|uniref:Uncharacterized protein n=1 Tax=Dryococelus australis TaxID=614101 RepID=A0ABQ9ICV8_9NEOP|nr:hypothetical protein PR048_006308 [Dryococelus australis]